MTRCRRRINLLSLFCFVVTLALLVGGSLWIDYGSSPVAATVSSKFRYDPQSPRDARLAQGSRTFVTRNRYHYRVPVVGAGVLLTLGAMGWRTRSTSRRTEHDH